MGYNEILPKELLSLGFSAPEVAKQPWCVRWDRAPADVDGLVLELLAPVIDFHTSGSTGPSQRWSRRREKVWAEAGMLADLLAPQRPQSLLSFVPPVHLYGALATVLVPARLGVPAWYRPTVTGTMPDRGDGRWVVVATPWIFTVLLRHLPWVLSLEQLTVLHSSAMLPASAGEFLARAQGRAQIVEVLGSTEAGGVATRRWDGGEPPPWELFPDVIADFDEPAPGDTDDGAVPLAVRSPRIAFRPGAQPAERWVMDDFVHPVGDRGFRLTGRRSRLVKVNGRRVNIDELEQSLRPVMRCADVALRPVPDAMIGEHVELLVVPRPGEELADVGLAAAFAHMGFRPRRVHRMDRIERSETGKLRHHQEIPTADAEAEK